MGFNLFMGTYFQAVEETKISIFIMFSRSLGMTMIFLYPMAKFYGRNMVNFTICRNDNYGAYYLVD